MISRVTITVVAVAQLNHLLNYEQNTKYNFPQMKNMKRIYTFGNGSAEGNAQM